jgi:iron complex outermembrane recepter protein
MGHRFLASIVCLSMCSVGWALDLDSQQQFDIPAQKLSTALVEFSRQAKAPIVSSTPDVERFNSPGVTGRMSLKQALRNLLQGTGLEIRTTDNGAIAVGMFGAKPLRESESGDNTLNWQSGTASNQSQSGSSQNTNMASSSSSVPSDAEKSKLDEIIVTAEKRSERLHDVPIPVTALQGDTLADSGQVLLQDYASSVPGLNLNPYGHSVTNLTIRGIPGVGILVDGVPYLGEAGVANLIQPGPPDIDPNDIARVEVLRGPQGTLYGASGKAGLINYITKDPSTDGFSGTFQAGTSEVQNGAEPGYEVRGAINQPINDTLAVRASGFTRQDPGYIDNPFRGVDGINEANDYGGRLSALWKPSDIVSLKVSALYQQTRSNGATQEQVGPGFGDLQQNLIAGAGITHRTDQAYSAVLTAKLGYVDLTSITGYSDTTYKNVDDWSFAIGPGTQLASNYGSEKISQELRLSGSIWQGFDWLVGGFFMRENQPKFQYFNSANPTSGQFIALLGTFPESGSFHEFAEFATLTYHFNDQFDMQLGGRETQIKEITDTAIDTGEFASVTPGYTVDNDAFTYLISPRFKLTPDVMIYGRVASGFSPGSGNTAYARSLGAPDGSNPEKTLNYEAGMKGEFLDRRITLDTSVYYTRYTDLILNLQNSAGFGYSSNGGAAKSEGIDFSIEAKPINGLTVGGWVSYDDAVLTQAFPSTATVYGVPGDRLPLSQRWSGQLSLNEDVPLGGDITGFIGGKADFVGQRLDVFTGTAERTIFPAYRQTDLLAGVRVDSWIVNIYANNVANVRGILASSPEYFGPPDTRVFITPRTIGANFIKTF